MNAPTDGETPTNQSTDGLWGTATMLATRRHVDLTHAFAPGIPHAPDFPDEVRETLYDFATDGFQAHRHWIVGQWGTHCDAPIHFAEGGRTLDEVTTNEMVAPLVVFHVRDRVAADPDYAFTAADVKRWEEVHGPIPPRAFVALDTGWSARWPDPVAMANRGEDGIQHTPGWATDALAWLCDERSIVGCGHDTMDTDPGLLTSRDQFPAETEVLSRDRYQIELLTDLDRVPSRGALVIASFPKPERGSGFPARVFAVLPDSDPS